MDILITQSFHKIVQYYKRIIMILSHQVQVVGRVPKNVSHYFAITFSNTSHLKYFLKVMSTVKKEVKTDPAPFFL